MSEAFGADFALVGIPALAVSAAVAGEGTLAAGGALAAVWPTYAAVALVMVLAIGVIAHRI